MTDTLESARGAPRPVALALTACPFCSRAPYGVVELDPIEPCYAALCVEPCNAVGPYRMTPEDAAEAWNGRAIPADFHRAWCSECSDDMICSERRS